MKQIIVTDIQWDAPKSADLPQKVVIDVNKDTEYLLEDLSGYADALCNYLSDEYEYCIKGFNTELVGGSFYTACRENGDFIDNFDSYEDAMNAIKQYEAADEADGIYEEGFYDIVDKNHCTIKDNK